MPFAGVGPFALVIARREPTAGIVAIELNPDAFSLMEENIVLNRFKNIKAIKGDANVVLKKYRKWADRIVMPLPHTGETFLDAVIPCLKKGGVFHFYDFGPNDDPYSEVLKKIKAKCRELDKKCRVVFKRIVRPYSPRITQVVVDVKVS